MRTNSASLRRWTVVLATLPFALGLGGCPTSGLDGGGLGVAPGGVQDMALARVQIESGVVPSPNTITVEGFLREHDIPLPAPDGAPEIFASVAAAWRHPFDEAAPMGELYVGLGTTRDLDSFTRPPLNLVIVVDRSESMLEAPDDPYPYYYSRQYYFRPLARLVASRTPPPEPDYPTKLTWARNAVNRIIDQLNDGDLVTVISFNADPQIVVPTTVPTNKDSIKEKVSNIRAQGNTDLYAGLKRAFEEAARRHTDARSDRVILFTDALPTEGLQTSGDFIPLVEQYAAQDVGLTLMGLGQNFGTDLGLAISALRGGNSFFIDSETRLNDVTGDEFKFYVTPAAYDLSIQVVHESGLAIRDVFGVADYVGASNGALIRVPTLFFSRREGGGAIVIRFSTAQTPDFSVDQTVGTLSLRYTLPDGSQPSQDVALTIPAGTSPTGEPPYFSDPSAERASVLLDTALVLQSAARLSSGTGRYSGGGEAAATLLTDFLEYFDAATLGMADKIDDDTRSLSDERDLLQRFLSLVGSAY
ncbi:MAG: VWA domain-containing protein [Phycisphaerales bacterium]|nr:VWA domain-containing protein [Phycisphaerales bacterium]